MDGMARLALLSPGAVTAMRTFARAYVVYAAPRLSLIQTVTLVAALARGRVKLVVRESRNGARGAEQGECDYEYSYPTVQEVNLPIESAAL